MRKGEFSIDQLTVNNILGGGAITNIIVGQGKKLYVDSVHGSDGNPGIDPAHAKATIFGTNGAMASCTASHGDHIFCLPGHIESIIAAAGGTASKIGVSIWFLGSGSNKAQIAFGTGTVVLSDLNISAAGVNLIGPKFVASIDALSTPIHITAADVSILQAEWYDAPGLGTSHAILASSAADRLTIDGWKYVVSTTGTQKHSNIQLAGGDHITLKNIDIAGDFNVAPIESTAALTNVLLENVYVNNTNVGPLPGLNIHANSTGFAKNVKSRVASGTTYVTSVGKIQWADDCEGFSTDGYAGEPIGSVLATGIEGKIDIIDGYLDKATANTSTNLVERDVIGNKADTARSTVSALSYSLMAYVKSLINEMTAPTADATTNVHMRDVIGIKSDAAKSTVSATSYSLVGYVKGVVNAHHIPVANTSDNVHLRDVVGGKADASVTAVSSAASLVAYAKALLNNAKDATLNVNGAGHILVTADLSVSAQKTSGTHEILAVSGMNRVRIVPICTENLTGAGANIALGTSASTASIIGKTTCTGIDLGESWLLTTANVPNVAYSSIKDIITSRDIGYDIEGTSTSDGLIAFHMWWEPLEANASCVAGVPTGAL